MADSHITKRALASAFKELMEQSSFEKISVADICEKCGMNRKSFYYHFRDKYDLANWIFDSEFIAPSEEFDDARKWEYLNSLCLYFYDNRNFYRKILKVEGPNSFREHFREFLNPILLCALETIMQGTDMDRFYIDFLADACICAFVRWLMERDCMPPERFAAMFRRMVEVSARHIYQDLESGMSAEWV